MQIWVPLELQSTVAPIFGDLPSFRRELKPFGIKCSMLEPGGFRTCIISHDFVKNCVERAWNRLSDEVKEEYGEKYKEESKS